MLAMVFAVIVAGCGAKDEAKEFPPESGAASSANPLTAPVDYLGAVAQAKIRTEIKVALMSLDNAIRLFQGQEGRFPKDLNELISKNYLPKLPNAPAHTQFAYDATTGKVELKAAKP